VLGSSSQVRADVIRQMHERPNTQALAEVLMDIEVEPRMHVSLMRMLDQSLT